MRAGADWAGGYLDAEAVRVSTPCAALLETRPHPYRATISVIQALQTDKMRKPLDTVYWLTPSLQPLTWHTWIDSDKATSFISFRSSGSRLKQ